MGSEMELPTRCPAEIPCQFDHKRGLKIHAKVDSSPGYGSMPWAVWICAAILAERRLSALEDRTSAASQTEITQDATVRLSGSCGSVKTNPSCQVNASSSARACRIEVAALRVRSSSRSPAPWISVHSSTTGRRRPGSSKASSPAPASRGCTTGSGSADTPT